MAIVREHEGPVYPDPGGDPGVPLRTLVLGALAAGGALLVWQFPALVVPVGVGAALYAALDRLASRKAY